MSINKALLTPLEKEGLVKHHLLIDGVPTELTDCFCLGMAWQAKNIHPNTKPLRKIIQIIDCPETTRYEGCLTALCDDGTIWRYDVNTWTLLDTPIPQD